MNPVLSRGSSSAEVVRNKHPEREKHVVIAGRDVSSSGSGGSGGSGKASGSTAVWTADGDDAKGAGDVVDDEKGLEVEELALDRDLASGEVKNWAVRVNSRGSELGGQAQEQHE